MHALKEPIRYRLGVNFTLPFRGAIPGHGRSRACRRAASPEAIRTDLDRIGKTVFKIGGKGGKSTGFAGSERAGDAAGTAPQKLPQSHCILHPG